MVQGQVVIAVGPGCGRGDRRDQLERRQYRAALDLVGTALLEQSRRGFLRPLLPQHAQDVGARRDEVRHHAVVGE